MTCGITSGQRDRSRGWLQRPRARSWMQWGWTREAAQCVITHGDEFAVVVGDAVRAAIRRPLPVPQDFTTEQVASSWVYPPEYKGAGGHPGTQSMGWCRPSASRVAKAPAVRERFCRR